MHSSSNDTTSADRVYRHVAHVVYQRMAFASFVIWTAGTFLMFITFAAGNPRPIPSAVMSMLVPVIPATALWLFYRPLAGFLAQRQLRQSPPDG
ncbi:MAG: hypothetical protein U0821_09075 [Chloroflexota bacterium]